MSNLVLTIGMLFIVLQLGLITWMLVGHMRALVQLKDMIHNHIHGITNYLAEAVSELRTMRAGAGILPEQDNHEPKVKPKPEHGHGHHHN